MKGIDDRRYLLTLLIAIYVCNTMDRHILSILAVPITRDLALSDTQFGLLSGLAFALFYTFFGIPAGWLADRFGRIRVLFAAATIWSVFSAVGALATNFWHLALSRGGVGIGEAGGAAPSYSLISSAFPPEKRGNAIGLFHLGPPIATVVSSVVASWIAVHYGWRVALVAVSVPGALLALLLWLTVRRRRKDPASAHVCGDRSLFRESHLAQPRHSDGDQQLYQLRAFGMAPQIHDAGARDEPDRDRHVVWPGLCCGLCAWPVGRGLAVGSAGTKGGEVVCAGTVHRPAWRLAVRHRDVAGQQLADGAGFCLSVGGAAIDVPRAYPARVGHSLSV
jgi:MFS family permease